MAARIWPLMKAFWCAARPAMKTVASIALSVLLLGSAQGEVVYSNLNTDPGTSNLTYGFTQFAQRFTTVSAGTGFHLDVNIISPLGTQSFAFELWSADGAGTNVHALLASIGGGSLSTADASALTSLDLTYSLAASTNYFVKLTTSPYVAWVLGPSNSTALQSVFRYGMDDTLGGMDNSIAVAMKVDVATVGVPEIDLAGIGSVLAFVIGSLGTLERRRLKAA